MAAFEYCGSTEEAVTRSCSRSNDSGGCKDWERGNFRVTIRLHPVKFQSKSSGLTNASAFSFSSSRLIITANVIAYPENAGVSSAWEGLSSAIASRFHSYIHHLM